MESHISKNAKGGHPAGYAVALGKEVIILAETIQGLPFDIRDRNTIAYGSDSRSLSEALQKRLAGLTDIVQI